MKTSWPSLVWRLLLVLGLVAGPWPSAIAATASPFEPAPATMQMEDGTPCPMENQDEVASPCRCCDDGAPCSAMQCVLSTPAPGLPVGATSFPTIFHVALRDAGLIPRSPEPRPGERLRPPIA
jgi:hypothetical protein